MTTVSNERGYRCLFLDWCFGNVWPPKILFLSMPNVCWHSEIWAKVCKNGHFDPEFFLYHITNFRPLLVFKIMSVQRLRNVRTETVFESKNDFFLMSYLQKMYWMCWLYLSIFTEVKQRSGTSFWCIWKFPCVILYWFTEFRFKTLFISRDIE